MTAPALEQLASYAASQQTSGLLVARDGRVLLERNWPLAPGSERFAAMFVRGVGAGGALREDVASQQKALIAILAAQATDRGLLDVEAPVANILGAGWTKLQAEPERAITVRHLLTMTSGLTEGLAAEAAPGERFFYNTPAYARLQRVLEHVGGLPLDRLTRAWLTGPLGMDETDWLPRPAELARASGNAWGLVTTPRDLARLAAMILDGGRDLVSPVQLAAIFDAEPTNPAYGRLWWLNNGDWVLNAQGERRDGALIPGAPRDLVLALGAEGRVLGIVPSRRLIAVRLGQRPPDADFADQFWTRVMAAAG